MRAKLPIPSYYQKNKGFQEEMEVLVAENSDGDYSPEGGYYLFDIQLGADYIHMMKSVTYISPNYSEERHKNGEYGWIPARDCTLISVIENNQQAMHLLKKV